MLSWNEIRARAAAFSREWADAGYEKGETQSFYNDFFEVFGIKRRKVASFEAPVKTLGDKRGFIDLFWKGMLLVEHKSAGRSLIKAKQQALDYFPGLKDAELPRYLLLSDFQLFELYDLDEGTEIRFGLSEFQHHVEHFGFVIGLQKRSFREQDPVNIHAAETLGRLHDTLKGAGYSGDDLQWLADDTGIFPERGSFRDWIEREAREDGANLGRVLNELFEILDTPYPDRQQHLDETLASFPYINGELFSKPLRMPAFNRAMRDTLLEASAFDWSRISPAIFGSLFQSVMDAPERRQSGAHYTSEGNILKLIQPLFMDALNAEFAALMKKTGTQRQRGLQEFLGKLSTLTVFDPACGCGNFLIIAYRELRLLEMQVLKALYPDRSKLHLKVTEFNRLINVDQFYGLELGEFPAKIAEVALWMMDHIMNVELGRTFGEDFIRIPLKTSPHIICGDALELDWQDILPAENCHYVLGNPPFVGAKYQTPAQREQVRQIAKLPGSGGTLDYVAAWFLKAGEYLSRSLARTPAIAFVATNSVSQGEQVAQLWPLLFDRYQLEISFAHRTFAWGSDARGMAHVHVVIIGLTHASHPAQVKRLFSYDSAKSDPVESQHRAISAYLFPADSLDDPHLVVREAPRSLMGYPPLMIGSKPIDGGQYIFSEQEKEEFLQAEPEAAAFLRPFVGAQEFINGAPRWILALHHASPQQLAELPKVKQRMLAVKEFRLASKSKPTQQLAQTPTLYHVNVIPKRPFLVIPRVSSERREYIPIGWLEPPIIPNDAVLLIQNAELWHFAILTSRMHMAWMRQFAGRLKSDYRYSAGLVYNPFPWPQGLAENLPAQHKLATLAQAVLDARALFADSTLAQLYDPVTMPPALRRAHTALDTVVDRLYSRSTFPGDAARVAHLFARYAEHLHTPLLPAARARKNAKRGAG